MENVKISVRQFFVIVVLFTIGTTILVIPAGLAAVAKQDAWISAFIGLVLNLLVVLFYIFLAGRFPNGNLIQYAEQTAGKWPGKLIALIFACYSFIGAATVLFYMGNFVTSEVMVTTPIEATTALFAIIVVMGVRLGLETLARTAELLFPWVLLTYTMMAFFLMPQIEINHLLPVFEAGVKPHIKASLSVAGTASLPFLVLLMIFPVHVNNRLKSNKAFLLATLIGGIFFAGVTFFCVGVMGVERTAAHMYPSYAVAKKVDIGDFIQRIEILIAAIWFITVFFKTTFYFYGFVTSLAQALNLKSYRPLVLPSGMLLVTFALVVYPNAVYMTKFDSTVYIPYVITIAFIIPLLLLLLDLIRKNFKNKN